MILESQKLKKLLSAKNLWEFWTLSKCNTFVITNFKRLQMCSKWNCNFATEREEAFSLFSLDTWRPLGKTLNFDLRVLLQFFLVWRSSTFSFSIVHMHLMFIRLLSKSTKRRHEDFFFSLFPLSEPPTKRSKLIHSSSDSEDVNLILQVHSSFQWD